MIDRQTVPKAPWGSPVVTNADESMIASLEMAWEAGKERRAPSRDSTDGRCMADRLLGSREMLLSVSNRVPRLCSRRKVEFIDQALHSLVRAAHDDDNLCLYMRHPQDVGRWWWWWWDRVDPHPRPQTGCFRAPYLRRRRRVRQFGQWAAFSINSQPCYLGGSGAIDLPSTPATLLCQLQPLVPGAHGTLQRSGNVARLVALVDCLW